MAQKRFLTVTAVAVVVALSALTVVGLTQYQRESRAFVSNSHVTNFPYSLLSPDAQARL